MQPNPISISPVGGCTRRPNPNKPRHRCFAFSWGRVLLWKTRHRRDAKRLQNHHHRLLRDVAMARLGADAAGRFPAIFRFER